MSYKQNLSVWINMNVCSVLESPASVDTVKRGCAEIVTAGHSAVQVTSQVIAPGVVSKFSALFHLS